MLSLYQEQRCLLYKKRGIKMDIGISENLKRLRAGQNITQEALAVKLGVSAQAVSKWERGDDFPDITMLPLIANYFCVTIDELFGYHGEREKQIDELVRRVREMDSENNGKDVCVDECLRLAREAAAEYPGSEKVLLCLADVLYNAGYVRYGERHLTDKEGFDIYDVELHRTYAEWREAIKLYEKLLESMSEGEERARAVRYLIQLYTNTGENEKGIKAAENFSELINCRELTLAYACDGKKRAGYLSETILKLVSLCSDQMVQTYIALGKNLPSTEAVRIIKNAVAMYDLVCTDGEYGFCNLNLRNLYLYMSTHQWRAGDHDGAFSSLDKALFHARAFNSYSGNSDITYTAPLLRHVKINPDGLDNLCVDKELDECWPWWCCPDYGDVKEEIQADPRWNEWVGRIKG